MGLYRRTKNNNKPLIRQVLDLAPRWMFNGCVKTHQSDKGCSKYRTYDQFVALTFGQLNKCLTLSDISTGLGISKTLIHDIGLSQSPARSTMSDGNRKRNYQVFESLYNRLLSHYKRMLIRHGQANVIEEIKDKSIKLIDSSTISLCLSMFDWAKFRTAKGGIKIHTCWDDTMMIPDMVNITEAKLHDSKGLSQMVFPKNTVVVEDRAYFDFALMGQRTAAENTFITRIKTNTKYDSVKENEQPDKVEQDIIKDEIIILTGKKAEETGMDKVQLRLVHVYREEDDKVIEIITNNLTWSARTIADLYKKRWDIELFFKAIKQNLQIKTFVGTSENAVKSQIYIALITYLLLQLIKRTVAKKSCAFSSFVEKMRICLCFYLSLDYVCNKVGEGAKRVHEQTAVDFDVGRDLFSAKI